MVESAAKGIGSAIGSGVSGVAASKGSASALKDAASQSNKLLFDIYNQNRTDLAPYRDIGAGGLSILSDLYGLPFGGYTSSTGNLTIPSSTGTGISKDWYTTKGTSDTNPANLYSDIGTSGYPKVIENALAAFKGDPSYQFAKEQGTLATNQALNAQGLNMSGGQARALGKYQSGLAAQNYGSFRTSLLDAAGVGLNASQLAGTQYNQYFNRLASLSGLGQTATATTTDLGSKTGTAASSNILGAGQATASSYIGSYKALNSGLNSALAYSNLGTSGTGSSYLTGGSGADYGGGATYDAYGNLI